MDVSKLSEDDLRALAAGDMGKVSTEGLRALAGQPARRTPPKLAPEDVPGVLDTLLIGAGRTADRVGKGMQQIYYGLRGNDTALADLKQRAEDDDRAYKPLQEARPWATGIGEALPAMALPAGTTATLLGNAGRMAALGALPGVLEYGSAGERATRGLVGAVAGAAVPLTGAAVKSAYSFTEPLFNRGREAVVGRTLNRVAGDAPDVITKLKNAQPLVPGSMPTAAEVAESGGIAALQRSASAANPEAYTRRAMEQSSARLNALRSVAGDDAAMAAANTARESATKALYQQADAGLAPIDGFFSSLMQRGQFNTAVKRAQQLANDRGLADIFMRDSKGKPIALIGEGAHLIKKALDEAAEAGSSSYTGRAGAEAAGNTNKLFQEWLQRSIPEYDAAKTAFATLSKPINQMEVGRDLLNKVQPALADYGALGRETSASFARALRDGDATAARATGFSGARMQDVLTPDQLALVEGVAKDLARKSNAQDLGRGVGSDTFQKLSMQNIAQQSGMPRLVGGLLEMPGVSRATAWAYRDTDAKMQEMLADALLDPQKAAALMERANKKWLQDNPKVRRLLEQAVVRSGGLLGLASTDAVAQTAE